MSAIRTHRQEDDSEDQADEFDRAIVEKHVVQLIEHFDSVQIVVTRYDPQTKTTNSFGRGGGNFHARWGSMKEWLDQVDEQARMKVREGS